MIFGLLRSPKNHTYLNPGSWTPGYGGSDRAAVGGEDETLYIRMGREIDDRGG